MKALNFCEELLHFDVLLSVVAFHLSFFLELGVALILGFSRASVFSAVEWRGRGGIWLTSPVMPNTVIRTLGARSERFHSEQEKGI